MLEFVVLDWNLLMRLIIDLLGVFMLVRFGSKNSSQNPDTVIIYYMFGIGVFFVTYAFKLVEVSMGFAFGLFAIFSMLRYRTEVLSIKEMTSLFLVVVISLLSAISSLNLFELVVVVGFVGVTAFLMDLWLCADRLQMQTIRYEKIENIRADRYEELLQDLQKRTGLDIVEVSIKSIDFIQDSAQLTILSRANRPLNEAMKVRTHELVSDDL